MELNNLSICQEFIISEEYADFFTDFVSNRPLATLGETETCIETITNEYGIVHAALDEIPPVNFENYSYSLIPNLYALVADFSVTGDVSQEESGIEQLKDSPLSLSGRGVMIGYLDTGIDISNDAFRYSDGSTKIVGIWDQTVYTGTPPEGFLYGSEFRREDINQALQTDEGRRLFPSKDEIGHGTAIAGTRSADNAMIAMVKLKPAKNYLKRLYRIDESSPLYQETDMLMAVKYLDQLATFLGVPLVICIGLGSNMGDHQGTTVLSYFLNQIADKDNREIIVAGGNEGNARHHYEGVAGVQSQDEIEIKVGENETGMMIELWAQSPDVFSVAIRSPGGERIPRIPITNRESKEYGFVFERSRVTIDYLVNEISAGNELIILRFEKPTPGIWTIYTYQNNEDEALVYGTYHMWLPCRGMISDETYFLESNQNVTLTEPSLGADVISVSTYQAQNGSFYVDSGRGYSRLGRIKPDIAAPGVDVETAIGRTTGSCMAAALTAGAVALFFEWAVTLGNLPEVRKGEVKFNLINGAVRDNDLTYPNRMWGYGKLNIFDSIAKIIR
ncbi:MAG: S8 family peptidase [Clostridia bacterium]|nr:S8 family peptidase [Clostridia bacterium]